MGFSILRAAAAAMRARAPRKEAEKKMEATVKFQLEKPRQCSFKFCNVGYPDLASIALLSIVYFIFIMHKYG